MLLTIAWSLYNCWVISRVCSRPLPAPLLLVPVFIASVLFFSNRWLGTFIYFEMGWFTVQLLLSLFYMSTPEAKKDTQAAGGMRDIVIAGAVLRLVLANVAWVIAGN